MADVSAIDSSTRASRGQATLGHFRTPSSIFPPFPEGEFDIIYADPPWHYKGQLQHNGSGNDTTGGAVAHYNTVSWEELSKLDVKSIAAENCLLFMWSSSPHLDQAIRLGMAWGFKWATVAFVWDKKRVNPGHYTMSQCELCLVFKIGCIPKPRGGRNVEQLISEKRTVHSQKPDEVRNRIDTMFPWSRKLELFARETADNWQGWGLECNG